MSLWGFFKFKLWFIYFSFKKKINDIPINYSYIWDWLSCINCKVMYMLYHWRAEDSNFDFKELTCCSKLSLYVLIIKIIKTKTILFVVLNTATTHLSTVTGTSQVIGFRVACTQCMHFLYSLGSIPGSRHFTLKLLS